jgi:hypothetical protein
MIDYIDESKADDYLGKVVLVGISYLDHEGTLLKRKQWVGTIAAFSREKGIVVDRRDNGSSFALPPFRAGIRKAKPGIYRSSETGEEVVDPDYIATWDSVSPDPSKVPNQSTDPAA